MYVSVFILPPSLAQLKRRLEGRPGADEKSVQSRLDGAGQDILRWGEYDYAIVNDNLDTAFTELRAILYAERNKRARASLGMMVDTLLKDARLATKTQSGSATGAGRVGMRRGVVQCQPCDWRCASTRAPDRPFLPDMASRS
jgi:hypothetical protein